MEEFVAMLKSREKLTISNLVVYIETEKRKKEIPDFKFVLPEKYKLQEVHIKAGL